MIDDGKGGHIVINEADFDPQLHQRYQGSDEVQTTGGDPRAERIAELEGVYDAEGYGPIKKLGDALGVEKDESGWRETIPAIVDAEGA